MNSKPGLESVNPANHNLNPRDVIAAFFEQYQVSECQSQLWDILGAAFSSEVADSWNGTVRGNAVFFFGCIDSLIKAAFDINQSKASS